MPLDVWMVLLAMVLTVISVVYVAGLDRLR
jgi:hypothetical protein